MPPRPTAGKTSATFPDNIFVFGAAFYDIQYSVWSGYKGVAFPYIFSPCWLHFLV